MAGEEGGLHFSNLFNILYQNITWDIGRNFLFRVKVNILGLINNTKYLLILMYKSLMMALT